MKGTITTAISALCGFVLMTSITATYGAEQLTLSEALAKAARSSKPLAIAAYDEQTAAENIYISRSGYLPRIDLQGGYTAQQAPQSISLQQGSFETQQADYGFFNASLYETIYDFGRTSARVARAQATRDALEFDYRSQRQDIFLRVVTLYFRILQGQKLVIAADEEVAQMTGHLRLAQNFFEQGVVTRNDLLQAEVRLASSRQRRLDVANRLDNFWLAFNDLTGERSEYRQLLVEETKIDLPDQETPTQDAISTRTEILSLRKLVDARESEVKEARAGFFPEVFARLGLDYVQNNKVKEQAIMAGTVGLKWNVFEGGATTARYRQAVANRSRILERLRQLESDLSLEYRTALNDLTVAAKRTRVIETSIRQGEENLRINKDRYQEQVGTATDVIDAQTLLTQTRTEYYQAMFDYEVALARVKRARGDL